MIIYVKQRNEDIALKVEIEINYESRLNRWYDKPSADVSSALLPDYDHVTFTNLNSYAMFIINLTREIIDYNQKKTKSMFKKDRLIKTLEGEYGDGRFIMNVQTSILVKKDKKISKNA